MASTIDEFKAGARQYRAAVLEDLDTEKSEMLVKVVPYGVPTDIGANIVETFLPGSFERAAKAPHRLGVWAGHGGPLIGRGIAMEDRPDGVWTRSKLSRSQVARDAIQDIADGISADVSVEFIPKGEWMDVAARPDGGLNVVHRRAHLLGHALVPDGAYGAQAFIASIRADDEKERKAEEARLWLQEYRRRHS